ncbi:MAG: transglutaminase family protein [Candidatus Eremiobacteraeota bacterium]|nr:transglutaminase family protein [Candidatus Eremiobacteraeota bacterium]
MQFTIAHETTYRYAEPIHESYTICHLQPLSDLDQYCTRFELSVIPRTRVFSYADRFGNFVQHFSVIPEHPLLSIAARSTVVTARPQDPQAPSGAPRKALLADPQLRLLYDFLSPSPLVEFGRNLRALSDEIGEAESDVVAWYLCAGKYIKDNFAYIKRATTVHTTVDESVRLRAGVCQDFAHVLIALCRLNGIPARYVSGYIFSGQGDSVLGAEASHAWCEAYLPEIGWFGYDPTNGKIINEYFVKIAIGRDYRDVSPVRGVYKGLAKSTMSVNVAMDELYDVDRERALARAFAEQQQQQQQ